MSFICNVVHERQQKKSSFEWLGGGEGQVLGFGFCWKQEKESKTQDRRDGGGRGQG